MLCEAGGGVDGVGSGLRCESCVATLNGYRGATRESCGVGGGDGGGDGGGSGGGGGGDADGAGGDGMAGSDPFGVAAMLDSISQRGAQNAEAVRSPG